MRRFLNKLSAFTLVMLLLTGTIATAHADEQQLKINDEASFKVGDRVKFTLNLSETKDELIGFEMRLFYDNEFLQFQKNTLKADKFDTLYFNQDIVGKIPMNWTDIGNPVSFAEKAEFLSCDFVVQKPGATKISYFITELYGDDMTYLKSYKFTYDLTVNDKKVVSDAVMPITDDEETLKTRQSTFINYVDGMGEENSPNKDHHESVVGKQHSTLIEQDVVENTKIVDVTKDKGNSGSNPLIFVLIGIPVIVALIVVAIVLANKRNKKNDDGVNEPKFDLNAEQQAMEEAGEIDDEDGM